MYRKHKPAATADHRRLPPGPNLRQRISLALPWNRRNKRDSIEHLRETHGSVVGLHIGSEYNVFLSDFEAIKKAFVKDKSTGRGENICELMNALLMPDDVVRPGGVTFTNGDLWTEQRKISLSFLGRRSNYANQIFVDARTLVERLNSRITQQTHVIDGEELLDLISARVINIMHHLILGGEADDEISKQVHHAYGPLMDIECHADLMMIRPWLRHLPYFSKCFNVLKRGPAFVRAIASKALATHRQAGTESIFMKHYMTSLKKLHGGAEPKETYYDLERTMTELFAASGENTPTAITFAVLYMAKFPHVLERMSSEVDAAWTDDTEDLRYLMESMPYTRATIHELLRHVSLLYVTQRTLTSETEIQGYTIPAKTEIFANLWAVNRDKNYWRDPENFRPERFIKDIDGKTKFVKDERVVAFSFGRRSCIGESMATDELFVFLIFIVKHFNIKAPEGEELDITAKVGLVHRCPPFRCTLSRR